MVIGGWMKVGHGDQGGCWERVGRVEGQEPNRGTGRGTDRGPDEPDEVHREQGDNQP